MKPDKYLVQFPYSGIRCHQAMTLQERAAQFAPFAALTGYEEAIAETGRYVAERQILSDEQKGELDQILQQLEKEDLAHTPVRITYFWPDPNKPGGTYETRTTCIRRIDYTQHILYLENNVKIDVCDIYGLGLEEE